MTTTTTLPSVGAKGVNPLKALLEYGQSPWMDYIRRDLLTSGGLKKMIQEDGLMGMTSNPTIFEKAITGSKDYADILESPEAKKLDAKGLYEKIAIRDVQDATDIFKPVYQQTNRRDGYVSLEVAPTLANDTQATIDEARRLWKSVGRENVMIKVPGTKEGLPRIRPLLEEGISINITLLFAQSVYEQVAEAFLAGLEARVKKGQDISHVASVASFFVSRIDTLIDSQIDAKLKTETDANRRALLTSIQGKIAIANAKLTYRKYLELFGGARCGKRWRRRARKPSACCGPAPAPRIRNIATSSTWKNSSAPIPLTPFLRPPSTPFAITDLCAPASPKTSTKPRRPWLRWKRPASP